MGTDLWSLFVKISNERTTKYIWSISEFYYTLLKNDCSKNNIDNIHMYFYVLKRLWTTILNVVWLPD